MQCDQTSKFIALLEIFFGNPDTEIVVFTKKRTVIQRCNSWLDFPGKAGKQWKEVSVSLAFDFVFVYLKPHFGEGGYCAQSRWVPVPGSRLLIKPLQEVLGWVVWKLVNPNPGLNFNLGINFSCVEMFFTACSGISDKIRGVSIADETVWNVWNTFPIETKSKE